MVLPYTTSSNRSTGAAIVDDTPSTVIQLIEAQCERTPDRIAVVCGNEKLTYEDLRRRSNGLARLLLERGVRPKSIVAICVERSTAMLVALLGILKSGAAYVPIDPDY
ncbi:MAG: AMP-binding protein, partial [Acidobacteriaceae bacterium]|nr:AMP-binding protein [Acidobacteriaceae bacterium]